MTGLLLLEYYNITCLLIQFMYSPTSSETYYAGAATGGLIACCSIAMIVLYALRKGQMGEFHTYFKPSAFAQKYELYQFISRLVLISLMITMSGVVALSYIMPLLPLVSVILLAVFKPYSQSYNTYRAIFNECCLLVILTLYSYYRLEIANYNVVNEFSLYLPLGVVGLLLLVLAVNIVFVIKSFVQSVCSRAD